MCLIILIILVLSSWWRNNFYKAVVSRNSDPWLTGLSLWATIAAPTSPLNAAIILLFLTPASWVYLNEKMGFRNFWIGIFSVYLIVVTSHDSFVDCWLFNLPFRVFAMIIPLSSSMRWVFMSEILCWWVCTFVHGLPVCFCVSVSCVNHYVKVEMFDVHLLVLFWMIISDII